MSNSGKKVLVVGGITEAGINNPKMTNPFLCKGKHHEWCDECNHSVAGTPVQKRGVSTVDVLALLFDRSHSLKTVGEMKAKLEDCYLPDCGTPFFLKGEHRERIQNEFFRLTDTGEKVCFIVKLYLVGCDDIVPEDILRALCGEINKLSYLQSTLVALLVRKRGARCVHHSQKEPACRSCSIATGKLTNKAHARLEYRNGEVKTGYASDEQAIPVCLELKF